MSKEVYIDSQGNEIPINSAPTYASQMPLSPTDDTDTAQAIDEKANITALPFVKYEEINVALDNTGEGTLFTSNKLVVGIKDIPSDSLYVGYAVYYAGSQTKAKALARNSLAFTSGSIISQTRKVGVYYLDNISVT